MSTSRSRWLTWAPNGSIIDKSPEPELPKPPKPSSGSFGSAPHGLFQKIEHAAAATFAPPTPSSGSKAPTLPDCPRCSSYCLYRKNNIGNYECLTCELGGITESTARRVQ
jgi:hypothetical protein